MSNSDSLLKPDNNQLAIGLLLITTFVFALQDGITRILAQDYHVAQFIMVRQWVFLIFALCFTHFNGGIKNAMKSKKPLLQIVRCTFWIMELIIFAIAIKLLQLAEIHALFAVFPLIVTLLAPFILGESLGWRRILAVIIGFFGALIIIRPGYGIFDIHALYALIAATMFAMYALLTRKVSRSDPFVTNLIYLAVIGAVVSTAWGIPNWQTPDLKGWVLIACLSATGLCGHVILMKALELAPASVLQPFNYTTLVWAILFGFIIFQELPDFWTIVGSIVIVSSGLFVIFRERRLRKSESSLNTIKPGVNLK